MFGQQLHVSFKAFHPRWWPDYRGEWTKERKKRVSPLTQPHHPHLPFFPWELTILWLPPGFQAVGGKSCHHILDPVTGGVPHLLAVGLGGITDKTLLHILGGRETEEEEQMSVKFQRQKISYSTFSHLADAFIQSDLQGCIHILNLHWWHTAHQEQLGVQCLAQGRFDRESN